MPKKTKSSSSSQHKKSKQGKTWNIASPNTPSSVVATFPDRIRVRLGYCTQGVFVAVTSSSYCWNPNGCFDPDQTGAGHQPYGYDQWSAMYDRYLVHKARYHVVMVPGSGTSLPVVGVTVVNGQNTALTPTQMTQAIEDQRTQFTMLGVTGAPPAVFRGTVPLASVVGAPASRYSDDDRYQALTSANPSEIVGLHIFAYDATLTTNVVVGYVMRVEYEVEFFDRKFPSQSLTVAPAKPLSQPVVCDWDAYDVSALLDRKKDTGSSSSSSAVSSKKAD